jgi:spore maturation protein CgeB
VRRANILYVGADSGTSRHRAQALRRLGNEVFVVDPSRLLPNRWLAEQWTWKTGALFIEDFIRRSVLDRIPRKDFDFAYVNGGELVGPALVRSLRERCEIVVNYNNDDPYGPRDGKRWRLYLQAISFYDLVVVVRECNVAEAFAAGARDVLRVYMSADEVAHAPRKPSNAECRKWSTDVAFIGTWMPERGPLLARLIDLGVPISIYGDRWHKAWEWPLLKAHLRGGGIYNDDDYAMAVQCAKICLGLLSKGNRDLSTTRSFEIPYIGGVLCAERTPEHLHLYREDKDAVFWSTPEECAGKCTELLRDHGRRLQIANDGRDRCIRNRTTNENVTAQILDAAFGLDRRQQAVVSQTK